MTDDVMAFLSEKSHLRIGSILTNSLTVWLQELSEKTMVGMGIKFGQIDAQKKRITGIGRMLVVANGCNLFVGLW